MKTVLEDVALSNTYPCLEITNSSISSSSLGIHLHKQEDDGNFDLKRAFPATIVKSRRSVWFEEMDEISSHREPKQ